MLFYSLVGGNFARTQSAVQFEKTFVFGLGNVLFHGCGYSLIPGKKFGKHPVGTEAQRTQQHGCGYFTRSVYVNPQHVLRILLVFEPGPAVRYNRSIEQFFARTVKAHSVINARTSY